MSVKLIFMHSNLHTNSFEYVYNVFIWMLIEIVDVSCCLDSREGFWIGNIDLQNVPYTTNMFCFCYVLNCNVIMFILVSCFCDTYIIPKLSVSYLRMIIWNIKMLLILSVFASSSLYCTNAAPLLISFARASHLTARPHGKVSLGFTRQ